MTPNGIIGSQKVKNSLIIPYISTIKALRNLQWWSSADKN